MSLLELLFSLALACVVGIAMYLIGFEDACSQIRDATDLRISSPFYRTPRRVKR